MQASRSAIDLIKSFEGLKLEAYKCPAGIWTIGYGTTKGVTEGMVITEPEALKMLSDHVQEVAHEVSTLLKIPVSQNQFDALVSFTYNVGSGHLSRSTLLQSINEKNFIKAATQFMDWIYIYEGASRRFVCGGLVKRRAQEKLLFTRGTDDQLALESHS